MALLLVVAQRNLTSKTVTFYYNGATQAPNQGPHVTNLSGSGPFYAMVGAEEWDATGTSEATGHFTASSMEYGPPSGYTAWDNGASTAPALTSSAATSITASTATLNGNISSNGNSSITSYGFYWGTTSNPTTQVAVGTTNFTGAYTAHLTGLSPNTTYYFEAYATNSVGTADGSVLSFTTQAKPVISPTTLPGGTTGKSYSQTLSATGGSGTGYTYTIISGSLPPGLTLNSNGTITGTPN